MVKCRKAMAAVGLLAAVVAFKSAPAAASMRSVEETSAGSGALAVSAQSRPASRPRTRIEVRPLPGPLRRECVAVFRERWIPQWGGWVVNPGQRCWWTRAPL
jgi:hypothetical protein